MANIAKEMELIMSLNGATILAGATLSATGGTAKTYLPDGLAVTNGLHLQDTSVADYRVRPNMTVKNRQPTYNPVTNVWTKSKRSIALTHPFISTDLKMQYPVARIEFELHPEMTDAMIDALMSQAAQLCFDPDFTGFYKLGNLF